MMLAVDVTVGAAFWNGLGDQEEVHVLASERWGNGAVRWYYSQQVIQTQYELVPATVVVNFKIPPSAHRAMSLSN